MTNALRCTWCDSTNEAGARSCRACGAPLDVSQVVSPAGWRAAPRLAEVTHLEFPGCRCTVTGDIIPVVDLELNPSAHVHFWHEHMVFKDVNLRLERTITDLLEEQAPEQIGNAWPEVFTTAVGPGSVSLSGERHGQVVLLPMRPEETFEVSRHALLAALGPVACDLVYLERPGAGGARVRAGVRAVRLVAQESPGLLVLHAHGNVMERRLAEGETLMIARHSFLYKDASAVASFERHKLQAGLLGTRIRAARIVGPGRLGLQSMPLSG